ncbi:ABC transporter substrate-binding protein [Marivita sp. S0852]|uniref:ABC transporter substrate-binding protein n=1 Tax=Marivita sp. S0852 TaxID=3373893 RepID=UPI003982C08D
MTHTLRLSAVLLSTTLAGAASAQDAEPIKVGVLLPTTGGCATAGTRALEGHEAYVSRLNANGGIDGRMVETLHRDSQCNPATATSAARDLVTKDGVDFLIGGVSSAEALAISEVARQTETVYMAGIPKTVQLTNEDNIHPFVFRSADNTDSEGKSAAILADRLGWDKVCTILLDYSYGHDLGTAFEEHLAELRPEAEIVTQVWPAANADDYGSFITELLSSDCDGVFSGIWSGRFPGFAKQASAFGFFDQFEYVSAGVLGSTKFLENMGDEMPMGIWTNAVEVFYYPQTEEHQEYLAAIEAQIGDTPDGFHATGYIAMQFIDEAIRAAGSTDSQAVSDALKGLTINTYLGPLTMREGSQQADRGTFWGQIGESTIDGYDAPVLTQIEYISADGLID